MRVFHTVSGLREALRADRLRGFRIGFVPTMGNLHDGHLALIKQARSSCDIVVCSIFVNALQFGLNEDWDKYPRTSRIVTSSARQAATTCFIRMTTRCTPWPVTQSRVICPTMTDVLCGASRPGHFEGVTTVVTKLFNIVQPDEAVFGIKDYQQLAVIRRMAEDLCMPVEITAAPIHREADGLAMSSRNAYITEEERPAVVILKESLEWIARQIEGGARNFTELEATAKKRIAEAGFKADYITVSHSKTLDPAAEDDLEITILGAMFTSGARLIDNCSISLDS